MVVGSNPATPANIEEPETCPKCGADLTGPEIPEEVRENYGGKTHFSKKIGIYDRALDRTVAYACGICGAQWKRP